MNSVPHRNQPAYKAPAPPSTPDKAPHANGMSLLELLVALTVLAVAVHFAAMSFVEWKVRTELIGAARNLGLTVTRLCAAAVASGRTHGLLLSSDGEDLVWQTVIDGDGDGVRRADVDSGVDSKLGPALSLRRFYPSVRPGRPAGVPPVGGGAGGVDGLAFGRSPSIVCSPGGGGRAGTLYLRSILDHSAALRVYGPTSRVTLWWWDTEARAWRRLDRSTS